MIASTLPGGSNGGLKSSRHRVICERQRSNHLMPGPRRLCTSFPFRGSYLVLRTSEREWTSRLPKAQAYIANWAEDHGFMIKSCPFSTQPALFTLNSVLRVLFVLPQNAAHKREPDTSLKESCLQLRHNYDKHSRLSLLLLRSTYRTQVCTACIAMYAGHGRVTSFTYNTV